MQLHTHIASQRSTTSIKINVADYDENQATVRISGNTEIVNEVVSRLDNNTSEQYVMPSKIRCIQVLRDAMRQFGRGNIGLIECKHIVEAMHDNRLYEKK